MASGDGCAAITDCCAALVEGELDEEEGAALEAGRGGTGGVNPCLAIFSVNCCHSLSAGLFKFPARYARSTNATKTKTYIQSTSACVTSVHAQHTTRYSNEKSVRMAHMKKSMGNHNMVSAARRRAVTLEANEISTGSRHKTSVHRLKA